MRMAQFIFTERHSAGLIARAFLGLVMLPHGLQKTLGSFDGPGFFQALESFDSRGIPYFIGILVIAGESLGAIALILGAFGRFMAASIIVIMMGAILTTNLTHGFFMNWSGMREGEGIEFHLLAIGLGLVVLIAGSGSFSIDRWLTRRYWG